MPLAPPVITATDPLISNIISPLPYDYPVSVQSQLRSSSATGTTLVRMKGFYQA
jgi:hypothetical protein